MFDPAVSNPASSTGHLVEDPFGLPFAFFLWVGHLPMQAVLARMGTAILARLRTSVGLALCISETELNAIVVGDEVGPPNLWVSIGLLRV